ncbi:hypothetical protein J2X20_003612 [Pelomonas saccharophila]|uniref:Uncharacterized protein n=1 Tax=Roseateles saccharophilus TaxID=304 RepID=A0ABU1YQ24_ROSSA|nr:hypothetical protein [Roseateles saccharophilus]MDR7270954.1 hypothetical protein [Roseateles saccharophilus]
MLNLIQRWLAGDAAAPWDLGDYPAWELPHAGAGRALSEAQAQANWSWFQATLDERQRRLRDWLLAHQGPDPQALHGTAYAKALNTWAKAHWPQLPAFSRLPRHKPWPDCPRSGAFIVNSLLGDLGASLGEAIRHANPDWHWGLNLDATDLADDMATARRVVLLARLKHPTPQTDQAVLDPEALLFAAHRFPDSVDFVHLDPWTTTVADAIAGGYHAH